MPLLTSPAVRSVYQAPTAGPASSGTQPLALDVDAPRRHATHCALRTGRLSDQSNAAPSPNAAASQAFTQGVAENSKLSAPIRIANVNRRASRALRNRSRRLLERSHRRERGEGWLKANFHRSLGQGAAPPQESSRKMAKAKTRMMSPRNPMSHDNRRRNSSERSHLRLMSPKMRNATQATGHDRTVSGVRVARRKPRLPSNLGIMSLKTRFATKCDATETGGR